MEAGTVMRGRYQGNLWFWRTYALGRSLAGLAGQVTARPFWLLAAVSRQLTTRRRMVRVIRQSGRFDEAHYRDQVAQLDEGADAIAHYVRQGAAAGYNPNPHFDTRYYAWANPDVPVQRINPFYHYLLVGAAEGRAANPLVPAEGEIAGLAYRTGLLGERLRQAGTDWRHLRYLLRRLGVVMRESRWQGVVRRVWGRSLSLPANHDTAGLADAWLGHLLEVAGAAPQEALPAEIGSVAVHAHVFYPSLLPGLVAHLGNIPSPFDLYVSVPDAAVAAQVEASVAARLPGVQLTTRICANRGRDIAPFVVTFAPALREYDLVCHVHTKRSPHAGFLAGWRTFLWEQLLGSPGTVSRILRQFAEEPRLGIVFPAPYPPVMPLLNWGGNRRRVDRLLQAMGMSLPQQTPLVFPAGSMFWARGAALRPLLTLGLREDDFEPEKGQIDGTLAHAIERALVFLAQGQDFDYRCTIQHRADYETIMARNARESSALYAEIPECRPFLVSPSDNPRRRLNLLIPSVNPSQAYGGISTALRLFGRLAERMGEAVDVRFIPTGVPPFGEALAEHPQMVPYRLGRCVPEARVTVVEDAAERQWGHLDVRRDDIFVATAWSTAYLANQLLEAQERAYGTDAKRRLLYLIQDFEPSFYPWSARYAMAEDTYRHGERTIAIFNSRSLEQHFHWLGFTFSRAFTFDPVLNQALAVDRQGHPPKQKQILVYGRPQVARNCFDIIALGLAQAVESADGLPGWRLLSVGEKHADVPLGRGQRLESLGKVSLARYRELLQESAIGVSLMLSPHPSYPPLEMAHHHLLTLTNNYGSKRMQELHDNLIPLPNMTPESLARGVVELVARIEADPRCGYAGQSHMPGFLETADEFSGLIETLVRELN